MSDAADPRDGRNRVLKYFGLFCASIGIAGTLWGIVSVARTDHAPQFPIQLSGPGVDDWTLASAEVEQLRGQLRTMSFKLETTDAMYRAVQDEKPEAAAAATQAKIAVEIADISKRMARLEKALSMDPERALSVPLLRKDLESLSAQMDVRAERTHDDIQRIDNYVFVLMISLLGTAGGLVVSLLLKTDPKPPRGRK